MQSILNLISAPDSASRTAAALGEVQAALARGERAAWLFPTQAETLATKKRLADKGELPLGVEMGTVESWARGRWSLYGDGRTPVSPLQRRLLARKALDECAGTDASLGSRGMVDCLANIARDAAGVPAFDDRDLLAHSLSGAQLRLVEALHRYRDLLAGRGLVELGEACAILARTMPTAGWQHLVLDGCHKLAGTALDLVCAAAGRRGATVCACLGDNPACQAERDIVELLCAKAAAAGTPVTRSDAPAGVADRPQELEDLTETVFRAGCGHVVEARGHVRACLPAGRYARPALLARQIQQLVEIDGIAPRDIVVAAKDPLALATSVADRLAENPGRGIAVAARGKVDLRATQVGSYVLAWSRILEAASADPDRPRPSLRPTASDLARNPLSGIKTGDALKLDERWRGHRTTGAARMAADLREASPHPEATDLEGILDGLDDRLGAPLSLDGSVEQAAAAAVREAVEECSRTFGHLPGADALEEVMGWIKVPKRLLSVPPNDIAAQRDARVLQSNPNAVRFVRLADLAGVSCRALVLCDLTADAYPVADRADARSRLWDALVLPPATGTLADLRRQLRRALEAPAQTLVLERLLNDADAQALRPSALLEELLDCYRADAGDIAGIDRTTGLPKGAPIPLMTLGEERFAQLAGSVTYLPAPVATAPATLLPTDPALLDLLAPRDHVWSPSGLEALISCPCRWLYERRLPNRGLDAGFDALARGTLCHLVLQTFHERMPERLGIRRIGPETPEGQWAPLFEECFDFALANQPEDGQPLVAVTEMERRKLGGIRRRLHDCVARDALLPEGFFPTHHELRFGYEDDAPVTIGGVRVHGVIDRVDVDPARNLALVIDYKGGLHEGHRPVTVPDEPGGAVPDPLPQHSQVLMYLAALRQAMPETGLAGGLYVSYERNEAAGFLDPTVLGPLSQEKGAYLGHRACCAVPGPDGSSGLEALLSHLDTAVADAVAELEEGHLEARPRFGKQSCLYCPVQSCPAREA